VNNLHIITLYKLHNKVTTRACRVRRVERVKPFELEASVSRSSCRACRARHSQNARVRHVKRVESCRHVRNQVEFGLYLPTWLARL